MSSSNMSTARRHHADPNSILLESLEEKLEREKREWLERKQHSSQHRNQVLSRAQAIRKQNEQKTLESLKMQTDRSGKVMNRIEEERQRLRSEMEEKNLVARKNVQRTAAQRKQWALELERSTDEQIRDHHQRHQEKMRERSMQTHQKEVSHQQRVKMNLERIEKEKEMKRRLLEEEEFNRQRESRVGALRQERSMMMASKMERVQQGLKRAKKIETENRLQIEKNLEEEERKRAHLAQLLKEERDQRRLLKEERAARAREQVKKAEREREMRTRLYEEQFELAVAVGTARRKHNAMVGHVGPLRDVKIEL